MSGAVLVVDDEEIVRNSVRQWLELGGFTVRVASGADEAMALLKERAPVTEELGFPRRTLNEKMAKHSLTRPGRKDG